ncbi:hypothetical protein K227x_41910 [Rubripirellula lacrimiformis]|uniref:Secreted protein n=1 Tax=Rubripirellula lacrimiformis TaxID=1930273 RepID=A0A517NF80_9BACT|nr:hypothetical protein [Rubripirellula lacrimiformis]QDT05786.1 hypothetical protein K227x_41910 [Rubripirellula lacrimiformis]
MFPQICRRLRRAALATIIAGTTVFAAPTHAGQFDCGSDFVPIAVEIEAPTSPLVNSPATAKRLVESASLARTTEPLQQDEELCGWVEQAQTVRPQQALNSPVQVPAFAGGWGTHDSGPIQWRLVPDQIAGAAGGSSANDSAGTVLLGEVAPRPAKMVQADQHAAARNVQAQSGFSTSALASTVVAATGVRVQQFAEPFALVGPYWQSSLASIDQLQSLYSGLVAHAESEQRSYEKAIAVAISKVALEEPIDASVVDAKVAVSQPQETESESTSTSTSTSTLAKRSPDPTSIAAAAPSIQVSPINPLVGGSGLIATIQDEPYMAYDLAPRDQKVWTSFAYSSRPFCVRSPSDLMADAIMWDAIENGSNDVEVVDLDAADAPVAQVESIGSGLADSNLLKSGLVDSLAAWVRSSPDCLLDEWVGHVAAFVDSPVIGDAVIGDVVQPAAIGGSIAAALGSTSDAAGVAIEALAVRMPKPQASPSKTGVKLLARAELDESDEFGKSILVDNAIGADQASDVEVSIATAPSSQEVR